MKTGTVKWFNAEMGYGYIQPDDCGSGVFVHVRAVERSGMDDLKAGVHCDLVGSTSFSSGSAAPRSA